MKRLNKMTNHKQINEGERADSQKDREPPPDNFLRAILKAIWELPPKIRWPVFLICASFVATFVVWTSLPPSSKERVIDRILPKHPAELPTLPKPQPSEALKGTNGKGKIPSKPPLPAPKAYPLLIELQDKHLISKLRDAEAYMDAGGVNSKEESLKMYTTVLQQLSPEARKELNQHLLGRAKDEERDGHIDDALMKYRAMFKEALRYNDKNGTRR